MKVLFKAFTISLVFIIICGIAYPLAINGLAQLIFPKQANGSIALYNGRPVGSELLGQAYSDPRFFHGRVSSVNYNTYKPEDTKPDKNGKTAYSGVNSGSANLGPTNPALADRVKSDMDAFLMANQGIKKENIPTDLLTSSGSGLDPNISPVAAKIQIPGISKATGISISDLEEIVNKNITGRQLGLFGDSCVNVLKVNIEIAKKLNIK